MGSFQSADSKVETLSLVGGKYVTIQELNSIIIGLSNFEAQIHSSKH